MCTTLEKNIALCAMQLQFDYYCWILLLKYAKLNASVIFRKLIVGLTTSFAIILLTSPGM